MTENPEMLKLIARLGEVDEVADCMKFVITKEYEKALKCFDEALNNDPDLASALFGKAIALNEIKEWGKGIQLVKDGLKIEPENELGLKIKGEIFYTHEKFDLAAGCYTKLTHLLPSDENVWFRMGEILEMEGKPDEATKAFREVLKINPENEKANAKFGDVVYRCPTCSDIIKEGETCLNCLMSSPPPQEKVDLDLEELEENGKAAEETDILAGQTFDEEVTETILEEDEEPEPTVSRREVEPIGPAEHGEMVRERTLTRGVAVSTTRAEDITWDTPAGRDWMTIRDLKRTKKGSAVNLIGLFCIIVLAIYFMYLAANPIYENLTGELDYEVLVPNLVIFLLGFGALYGGISAAKNSIIFDHFLNSTFESEIFQRLEPAFEEIAETQVRLEDIEMKMDRLNLNIQRYKRHPPIAEFPSLSIEGKISMFLKIVVVINMTIGIFLYTLRFPGEYAPYVFTLMFILWWLVITEEYKLWKNPTAWALVVLPVFAVPVMSILLYIVINIGILIGLIGIFLSIYAFSYFTWARYYVEGVMPFRMPEGDVSEEAEDETIEPED